MAKYRKKPVVIEAFQYNRWGDVPQAPLSGIDSDENWKCFDCGHLAHEHANCKTLEGYHIVCPTDWLIKGVEGEWYPCKNRIFEKTYEKVDGDD